MGRYLVELYVPTASADALRATTARARAAAAEVSSDGARIRCLRSIFVPEDETCFLLYDAPTKATVRTAVARAELRAARVVEAVAPR